MKVVYIADIGIAGGATKSLAELVHMMKEYQGVEPIVLTSGNNELNRILDSYGIENHSVGHGAFMHGSPERVWKIPVKWVLHFVYYHLHFHSSIKKALECVDWETVDIIHTNVARDDLGMEISKRTAVKNICHIREFAELDFKCWSYRPKYIKYLSENTDAFIAISEAVKKYWVAKGLPREKVSVIYNGVDSDKIKKADHSSWEEDSTLKLVITGGVIRSKGQWQAAEAVGMLPEEIRKHVTLDIIGGVDQKVESEIRRPFINAGIPNNIHFCGQCNDVYERLKDYHIGLMCSQAEGFGRVTVEYMHAGLAVIASNRGANEEIVEDGVTGLIYDRDNTKDLADKIHMLYMNRLQMISIAEEGLTLAKSEFTARLNAYRIHNYYQEVLRRLS